MNERKTSLTTKKDWIRRGLHDGIPICTGYFAVSFALGLAAREIGMTALQSFLMSLGMVASAGEFAAVTLIGAGAGVLEMIATTVVVNLRYFLMSCSLSQKIGPRTPFYHRFFLAYCMTDEIFGLSSAVEGYLEPVYTYAMTAISVAGWCTGTVLGVLVGNILPGRITDALTVAMYGMFLAIIIPPAKKNRALMLVVLASMGLSCLFHYVPLLSRISSGFQVILITVIVSLAAAFLAPIPEEEVANE